MVRLLGAVAGSGGAGSAAGSSRPDAAGTVRIAGHSGCRRRVVDAKSWSGIPQWLVTFLREVHEKRRVILVKS
jgi:hypothetical protein